MTKIPLDIEDIVIVGDEAYFFAFHFNGLYSMSMTEQKVHLCGRVPWEPFAGERLFASIEEVDGKIYLIPFSAHSIAVYDIEAAEFTRIEMKKELSKINYLFMAVKKMEKDLFLFGVEAPYIVKVDTVTNEIIYLQDWHDSVEPFIFNKTDAFFRRQVVCLDSKFYIPFCNANAVLELDSSTLKSTIHVIGEEVIGYSGICFDGDNFWCSPRGKQGCILTWNRTTDSKTYIPVEENDTYIGIVYSNNQARLISGSRCNFIRHIGENTFYFKKRGNTLVVEKNDSNTKSCILIEADIDEVPLKEVWMQRSIIETNAMSLKLFAELLTYSEMTADKMAQEHQSVGKEIYEKLR